MENKVKELLGVSIEKIRECVDVSTVIGDPIAVPNGTVLIPVSKVTYGFASGGSDLPNKNAQELFGGAGGAGINITPIAFIVCEQNNVRVLPMVSTPDTINQMANMVPDVIGKITGLIASKKEKQ
ncbi:MAG: sporulation protein YtfJ [Clostridia bacterium]|nr:sporulation protein YtfJ [Clostridia bacterium]